MDNEILARLQKSITDPKGFKCAKARTVRSTLIRIKKFRKRLDCCRTNELVLDGPLRAILRVIGMCPTMNPGERCILGQCSNCPIKLGQDMRRSNGLYCLEISKTKKRLDRAIKLLEK